jgi:Mor family transcriptional regulator
MIEKDIVILYESGLTIKEISEKFSFSYEKIRQILKKEKVKWKRNYVSDFTPDQIKKIIQEFDEGKSIKEIANWYEISPPSISRLLKANNKEPVSSGKKYEILRKTPINSIQKQFIVGTLLGDGCLYKDSKKGNYKLSFGHCKAQSQYFHWKIAMMDPFINSFRENTDKRGNSIMLQTATICHQDLNYMADMFYDSSRVKHIPKNLDMYLTPLSLAVWYQDDGNLKAGVNARIATMSFTEEENYMLRDYLKSCFNLKSKVMTYKYKGKQYWQISLNKENTQKLSDIIRPYVTECMQYKIMPQSSTTTCQTPLIKEDEDIV